jgi:uncharacterized protein YoxC
VIAGIVAEFAGLIGAVGFLVLCGVAWSIRKRLSHISTEVAGVKVTAEAVNKAVNNVPHGAPSLLDHVNTLHDKFDQFADDTNVWRGSVDGRLDRIEDHITRPTTTRKKAS